MLYKTYVISSLAALMFFSVAQYQGWSFFSESGDDNQAHQHSSSSGGHYNSGSHRGSYHK